MGYGATDNVRQKFTSKERDNETGLDYFLARYYSSAQGRFTSPDEFSGGPDELYDFAENASDNPTFYAELDNPQSLNKYQYTYNNPVNLTDDDGHVPCRNRACQKSAEMVKNNSGLLIDVTQAVISVAGLIPGAGEPADLVNAAISTARGNLAEAGLDLAGALGPVGSAAAVANRGRKIAGALSDTARAAKKVDNAADASRAGKDFTRKGKQEVIEQNKAQNKGTTKCTSCGIETVPGQKAKRGVPKPANETQVDHIKAKSRGGQGQPPNGQVLCRKCNQRKGNREQ